MENGLFLVRSVYFNYGPNSFKFISAKTTKSKRQINLRVYSLPFPVAWYFNQNGLCLKKGKVFDIKNFMEHMLPKVSPSPVELLSGLLNIFVSPGVKWGSPPLLIWNCQPNIPVQSEPSISNTAKPVKSNVMWRVYFFQTSIDILSLCSVWKPEHPVTFLLGFLPYSLQLNISLPERQRFHLRKLEPGFAGNH